MFTKLHSLFWPYLFFQLSFRQRWRNAKHPSWFMSGWYLMDVWKLLIPRTSVVFLIMMFLWLKFSALAWTGRTFRQVGERKQKFQNVFRSTIARFGGRLVIRPCGKRQRMGSSFFTCTVLVQINRREYQPYPCRCLWNTAKQFYNSYFVWS